MMSALFVFCGTITHQQWCNMVFLCSGQTYDNIPDLYFLYFAASLWKNVKKKFSRAGGHHWDGPSVQYIRSWVLSWKITYLRSRAERNWSGHYPQILITLLRSRGRLRSERLPFLFETIRNRNIIVYYILKSPIFLFFSFLFFPKCSSMRRAISVFHNSPLPFSTVL